MARRSIAKSVSKTFFTVSPEGEVVNLRNYDQEHNERPGVQGLHRKGVYKGLVERQQVGHERQRQGEEQDWQEGFDSTYVDVFESPSPSEISLTESFPLSRERAAYRCRRRAPENRCCAPEAHKERRRQIENQYVLNVHPYVNNVAVEKETAPFSSS